jgi:hypothetical protein
LEIENEIEIEFFMESFNSYSYYIEIMKEKVFRIIEEWNKVVVEINKFNLGEIEKFILRGSEMGIIKREKFRSLLK